MDFLREISNIAELPIEHVASFRYLVMGGKTAYVAGHKGIKRFTQEEIIFKTGKTYLRFEGNGFVIRHLSKDDAIIEGNIITATIME